jgi:phosphate transport system permease protein
MNRRIIEEKLFVVLMLISLVTVLGSLLSVFAVVIINGAPALSVSMITQTPKGGYYLGKEGGVLNAIVGSLYLASGATILSFLLSLPIALYIYEYVRGSRHIVSIRLSLDVLAGIPSIVFGAFTFTLMLFLGARTSLLWGMITVSFFLIPIMTRAIDEVLRTVPPQLRETSFALGSTRLELLSKVVIRQILPGLLTAVLLSFGRAIGDAAAVLLTTGYTDNIPRSLTDPVATLPLAIFFQLATPIPEVQQRAYASAVILLVIVMTLSILSRLSMKRLTKYVVR